MIGGKARLAVADARAEEEEVLEDEAADGALDVEGGHHDRDGALGEGRGGRRRRRGGTAPEAQAPARAKAAKTKAACSIIGPPFLLL